MKRCPQCLSAYDDAQHFCEVDGAPLSPDPLSTMSSQLPPPAQPRAGSRETWYIAAIGLLLGVLICVSVYFGFLAPGSQQSETGPTADRPQYQEQILAQQPAAPRTEQTRLEDERNELEESETPSEETAGPTPEASREAISNVRRFNDGPISTGTKRVDSLDAVVHFTDGTAIRVEAAWEDDDGVWYRRGGVVSYVERSRVRSITESAPQPVPEVEVTP